MPASRAASDRNGRRLPSSRFPSLAPWPASICDSSSPARRVARAKMRLADEYDAAQERGEVAGPREGTMGVVGGNAQKATAADLGLRRDEIHEARKLRQGRWLRAFDLRLEPVCRDRRNADCLHLLVLRHTGFTGGFGLSELSMVALTQFRFRPGLRAFDLRQKLPRPANVAG